MATKSDLDAFYRGAEPLTDPGPYRELLDRLPHDTGDLCAAVQGLVLNFHWAEAYGVTLTQERRHDAHARGLGAILARILAARRPDHGFL